MKSWKKFLAGLLALTLTLSLGILPAGAMAAQVGEEVVAQQVAEAVPETNAVEEPSADTGSEEAPAATGTTVPAGEGTVPVTEDTVPATGETEASEQEITGFGSPAENVDEQTLPVGSPESDELLPEAIIASVDGEEMPLEVAAIDQTTGVRYTHIDNLSDIVSGEQYLILFDRSNHDFNYRLVSNTVATVEGRTGLAMIDTGLDAAPAYITDSFAEYEWTLTGSGDRYVVSNANGVLTISDSKADLSGSSDHAITFSKGDTAFFLTDNGYQLSESSKGIFSGYYQDGMQFHLYRKVTSQQSAPDAPQNLSAAAGDGLVTLTWDAPADDGGATVTGYQVSTDGSTWTDVADTGYTVMGLTNGTEYTFHVRAVNKVGVGEAAQVSATPVKSTSQPPLATVFAASDYQAPNGNSEGEQILGSIIDAMLEDGFTSVDGALYAGDYNVNHNNAHETAAGIASIKSVFADKWPSLRDDSMVFIQGNHDPVGAPGLASSGAHDAEHYGVFVINEYDYMYHNDDLDIIKNTANNLKSYLDDKAIAGYSKPIFVISHLPLHYSMRTLKKGCAMHANLLVDVLNEAGENGLNIIFLYGHNHSNGMDDYLGGSCVYLAKGDPINIAQSSMTVWKTETLNFTYMNAGFTGYYHDYNDGTEATLTSTIFQIYDDRVEVSRYSANGKYNLKSAGVTNSYMNESGYDPDTRVIPSPEIIPLTAVSPKPHVALTSDQPGEILLNGKLTLTANSQNIANPVFSWESSDSSIASVSGTGETATVTGVSAGKITITVTVTGTQAGSPVTETASFEVAVFDQTTGNLYTRIDDLGDIVSGEQYLIVFGQSNLGFDYRLVSNSVTTSGDKTGLEMINTGLDDAPVYITDNFAQYEWTLTGSGDRYVVSNAKGVMTIGDGKVDLTGSADHTITFSKGDTAFFLTDNGYQLSESRKDVFSGYYQDGMQFHLYRKVTVPDAPQNLSAAAGDGLVTLTWDAPADDGGATVTGYQVSTDGSTWTDVADTSYTVTGLTNGTEYTFHVRAVNSVGTGRAAQISATPAPSVIAPGAPQNLSAAAGDGLVTLTWDAPADDGGATVTGYQVSTDGSTWTDVADTGYTVTGLTNGTEYTFHVRAVNSAGTGQAAQISATPAPSVIAPGAPQNLSAAAGDGLVALTWDAPTDDGGAAITGYQVSTDGSTWIDVADTRYTATGLTNGTEYTFHVRAVNSAGTGRAAQISATPAPSVIAPGAPQNLSAAAGDGLVALTWDAPADDGGAAITGYQVSTDGSTWTDVADTSYTVTGLTNGTEYTFYVRAVNSAGSGISSEVLAVPAAAPITFSVTYTDGVDGEEIFKDQVYTGLSSGSKTPAFSGTPAREGYTFTGWSPALSDSVTQNATYTAQWKKIDGPDPTNPGKVIESVAAPDGMKVSVLQGLEDAALTEDDRNAVAQGVDAYVWLEVDVITNVSASDSSAVKALLSGKGYKAGTWLDITLNKQLGNDEVTHVTKTADGKVLKISLTLPNSLINRNKNIKRTYGIVRIHEGTAKLITSSLKNNVLSFETDRFSTYCIVYHDSNIKAPYPDTPQTGDTGMPLLMFTLMLASCGCIGCMAVCNKRKRNHS